MTAKINLFSRESKSVLYIYSEADYDIQYALKKDLKVNLKEFSAMDLALDAAKTESADLYILDLKCAKWNDSRILKIIREFHPGSEILVSLVKTVDLDILDLLDIGITQFVRLPSDYDNLLIKIRSILDKGESSKLENNLAENTSRVLRNQLEWMNYKTLKNNIGIESSGKSIIENLRDSLVQVGGIGVILSMIDVIKEISEKKGNQYQVDAEMMEVLSENSKIANKQLEGLNRAISIMSSTHLLEDASSNSVTRRLPEILKETGTIAQRTGNQIYFPKTGSTQEVNLRVNYDLLAVAVEEITINALKYTNPGASIHIFTSLADGYFIISILNEYKESQIKELQEHSTELLIKPFLRMHPPVDRHIESEKIGMGLGLTVVYYIMGQMNGLLNISNVQNHTGENVRPGVLTQMYLPISY